MGDDHILVNIFIKVNSKYCYYAIIASAGGDDSGMDYIRIIKELRVDNDKTQAQIAEILGTSQTMYARYERGASEMPIRHLIALAKYYRVSTDYILGLATQKKNRHSF